MKVMYQALTKTLSYGYLPVEKPKVLLMEPAGVAAINIEGTILHSALNIAIGYFEKKLPPITEESEMKSRLSDLKGIIDEISIVSNDLLSYVHSRLNEIFGLVNCEPSAGVSVISAGDFFQLRPVGGILHKNLTKF